MEHERKSNSCDNCSCKLTVTVRTIILIMIKKDIFLKNAEYSYSTECSKYH